MAAFLVQLLDLCLIPFSATGNLVVFVPVACITISFLFALIFRLMRCL